MSAPKVGLTNLNGFPDIVNEGNSYTLTGFFKNKGSSNSNTPFRLMMSINGGAPIDVTSYFDPGAPINPGDSTYWFQTGYSFAASSFSGGFNDIIVWPEKVFTGGGGGGGGGSGGGWKGDSIRKHVIFVPSSPIKTLGNLWTSVFEDETPPTVDGIFSGEAGLYITPPKTNEDKPVIPVRGYYSCGGGEVNARRLIPFATVTLFTQDLDGELLPLPGTASEAVVTLFPNPASGSVAVTCPEDAPVSLTLLDKYGNIALSTTHGMDALDISTLRPGVYFVRTTHTSGKITGKQLVIE